MNTLIFHEKLNNLVFKKFKKSFLGSIYFPSGTDSIYFAVKTYHALLLILFYLILLINF